MCNVLYILFQMAIDSVVQYYELNSNTYQCINTLLYGAYVPMSMELITTGSTGRT
jgi:hypothetical protein